MSDTLLYNVGTRDSGGTRRWHGSFPVDSILASAAEHPGLAAQLAFLNTMTPNDGKYPEYPGAWSPNAGYRTARRVLSILAELSVESLPTKSGEPWPAVPDDEETL
jgi:hypothetical protein